MNTQKNITLDQLNIYAVNVKKETFGANYELLNTERTSYINDERGREQVQAELPHEQVTAIFTIWNAEQ